MASFNTRKVGRTSLEFTELGLGSATLAGMNSVDVPDDGARALVSAAPSAWGASTTAVWLALGARESVGGYSGPWGRQPAGLAWKNCRLHFSASGL